MPARLPGVRLEAVHELSEARDMLTERVMEWTEEWKQQGLQQGLQQGEAAQLRRLLELRFAPLDEATLRRLAEADAGTLLIWGERELESLAEVFGN